MIYIYSIPKKDLTIKFSFKQWENIEKIILEPNIKEFDFKKEDKSIYLTISNDNNSTWVFKGHPTLHTIINMIPDTLKYP